MVFKTFVMPWQGMGAAAYAIFLFQKSGCFLAVMPFHKIIIDAERTMYIAASSAKSVVYLILRDKIFFFYFHTVRKRKSFLLQKQVIKLCPQFLFGHNRTVTQLFFPAFKLPQCFIHMRSCHIHTLRCR